MTSVKTIQDLFKFIIPEEEEEDIVYLGTGEDETQSKEVIQEAPEMSYG